MLTVPELDVRTLAFVIVQLSVLSSVFLIILSTIYRNTRGLRSFTLAFLSLSVGFFLLSQRGYIPELLSVVLANATICLGVILMCHGILRFLKKGRFFLPVSLFMMALTTAALFYFTEYHNSVRMRVMAVSLLMGTTVLVSAVRFYFSTRSSTIFLERLLAVPFFAVSCFFFFRFWWTYKSDEISDFMRSGFVHELTFMIFLMLMVFSVMGMFLLITIRLQKRLMSQAYTDNLTGLKNRRYLGDIAAVEIARSQRNLTPLSIMIMDIDHFKQINDTFGHLIGDRVLKALGGLLREHLRGQDIAIRYGGEEFLVLLPETDLEQARSAAEKIRRLASDMAINGSRTPVTVSFGVSVMLEDELLETAIARADTALYKSKRDGRNRVTTYMGLTTENEDKGCYDQNVSPLTSPPN